MKVYCIALFAISLFPFADCKLIKTLSMQIKNLKISQCAKISYNVTVSDVAILIETPKIHVSGSLSSKIDLSSPISAKVWVERDILGIWIPIPCESQVGCCTYNDLCRYGLPLNETCPSEFLKNDVPCRCPISKGNYTMKPTTLELSEEMSILTGQYKGTISVMHQKSVISCYNFNFELYDGGFNENLPIVKMV